MIKAISIVAAISAALSIPSCKSSEEVFVGECGSVIKERLRSPSTYNLIEYTKPAVAPFTVEWWVSNNPRKTIHDPNARESYEETYKMQLDLMTSFANDGSRSVASTFIKYEAANAFGTPVASTVKCEAEVIGDALSSDPDDYRSVLIDGKTHFDWLIGQIKAN